MAWSWLLSVACLVGPSGSEPTDVLIGRLGRGDEEARRLIVERGEDAIEPLSKLLLDRRVDTSARVDAALSLGAIRSKRSVAALRTALNDRAVQDFAIIALGSLGQDARDALPDLIALLRARAQDSEERRRPRELIKALSGVGHGSKEAADVLALCMKTKRDEEAAHALTKIGVPGVEVLVSLAVKYSDDSRPEAQRRYGEAYSVLKSGTPLPRDAIPILRAALLRGGSHAIVAEFGLASVGSEAIPTLRELIADPRAPVRTSAARALAHMNFNAFVARTYRGEDVRDPVSSDEFFPRLKPLLRTSSGEVDLQMLEALVGIDHDRAMADPEIQKLMREVMWDGIREYVKRKRIDSKASDGVIQSGNVAPVMPRPSVASGPIDGQPRRLVCRGRLLFPRSLPRRCARLRCIALVLR